MAEIHIDITGDNKSAVKAVNETKASINQLKKDTDNAGKSMEESIGDAGDAFEALKKKVGPAALAVTAVTAAVKLGKKIWNDLRDGTQRWGDTIKRETAAADAVWTHFIKNIATGGTMLTRSYSEVAQLAREIYDLQDELFELQNSYKLVAASALKEMYSYEAIFRDTSKPIEERKAALEGMKELEMQLAEKRLLIAEQQEQVAYMAFEKETELDKETAEAFIKNYIKAKEDGLVDLEKEYAQWQAEIAQGTFEIENGLGNQALYDKLDTLRAKVASASSEVVNFHNTLLAYGVSNDVITGAYADAAAARITAQAEASEEFFNAKYARFNGMLNRPRGGGRNDKEARERAMKQSAEALERIVKEMELSIAQARIDGMEEGTAKTLAQMRLDYDKQVEEYKRQREDMLKRVNEDAKKQWLAANPRKKESQWKDIYTELPEEYAAMFAEQEALALQAYERQLEELFSEFGSKEQLRKRLVDQQTKSMELSLARLNELMAKEKKDSADMIEIANLQHAIAKMKQQNAVDLAKFDYDALGSNGSYLERIEARRKVLEAEAAMIEDEAQRAVALARMEVELTEMLYSHIGEYGNAIEQKNALQKTLEAQIREAEARGDSIGARILAQNLKNELANIDAEELLKSIDLASVFGDLGVILAAPLKSTVEKMREYTKTDAFSQMDFEDQKAFFEALANAERKLGGLKGLNFKDLGAALDLYATSLEKQSQAQTKLTKSVEHTNTAETLLTEAQRRVNDITRQISENEEALADAREKGDDSQAGLIETSEQLSMALGEANEDLESAEKYYKRNLDLQNEAADAYTEATRNVAEAQADAAAKMQIFSDNVNALTSGISSLYQGNLSGLWDLLGPQFAQKLGSKLAELFGQTAGMGDVYGMIIGVVFQLLDEFKEHGFGEIVTQILKNIGDGLEGIIEHFGESIADIFVDGIPALLGGIVKGFINAFGGDGEKFWNKVMGIEGGLSEKDIQELTDSNHALSEAVNELKDVISKSDTTITEATRAYNASQKALEVQEDNLRKILTEQGVNKNRWIWNKDAGVYTRTNIASNISSALSSEDIKAIEALTGSSLGNKPGSSILGMSPEDLKAIATYLPEVWSTILANAKDKDTDLTEYIQSMLDLAGALEENSDSFNEKLTGVSWDSFLSDFKSTLQDMDSEAADFANNFEQKMSNAILDSLVNDKYKERLRALYDKFAEFRTEGSAGGSNLTESEQEALRKQQQDITNELLEDRKILMEMGLVRQSAPGMETAQSAATQTITETTGGVIEGRLAAVQIGQQMMLQSVMKGVSSVILMNELVASGNGTLTEIRNLHMLEIGYLEDIAKQTKPLLGLNEHLERIENLI